MAQESEDVNNDGNFDGLDCQGVDGTNGANGTNCWDLNGNGVADIDVDDPDSDKDEDINNDGQVDALDCQGANGQQGDPGQDGNANVRKIEVDLTNDDNFLFGGGVIFVKAGLTIEDVENHTLLFFFETVATDDFSIFQAIPGYSSVTNRFYGVGLSPDLGDTLPNDDYTVRINLRDFDGNPVDWAEDEWDILHITLIQNNESSMSGKNGGQALKAQLKTAGVDISDYHAVMAHFGLE